MGYILHDRETVVESSVLKHAYFRAPPRGGEECAQANAQWSDPCSYLQQLLMLSHLVLHPFSYERFYPVWLKMKDFTHIQEISFKRTLAIY